MRRAGMVAAAVAAGLLVPTVAKADTIRVRSTTDTVDAGLVVGLLQDAYKAAQPGDELNYVGVGTGAAITDARNGLANIVITHAPTIEAGFVNDGYSLGLGRQIFYSDYVIVGPTDDPAGVGTKHPHDAIGAFEDIAAAGDLGTARFKTRNDNSGTNAQEQIMWNKTTIAKHAATNAGTDRTPRDVPGATTVPAWYVIPGGTPYGQRQNLDDTEACAAAGNGCYTMLDRGTYNKAVNAGVITHLKILAEKNDPSARGGENLLINPFSVYLVNPDKISTNPKPNVAAATRFRDFLVSPAFQAALLNFPSAVDPAFRPDAFPTVTLDAPVPQAALQGNSVVISGKLANRLPGSGPVDGAFVQLQSSVGGGAWQNAGGAVKADASGHFAFSVLVTATAAYRIATGDAQVTSYNALSPATTDIGTIAATPKPVVKDTTKPLVTNLKLGRTSFSLKVYEATSFTVTIQRRVKSGKKFKYRSFQTVKVKATKGAQTLKIKHKAFKRRTTYRVKFAATDLAGNKRTVTKTVTLR